MGVFRSAAYPFEMFENQISESVERDLLIELRRSQEHDRILQTRMWQYWVFANDLGSLEDPSDVRFNVLTDPSGLINEREISEINEQSNVALDAWKKGQPPILWEDLPMTDDSDGSYALPLSLQRKRNMEEQSLRKDFIKVSWERVLSEKDSWKSLFLIKEPNHSFTEMDGSKDLGLTATAFMYLTRQAIDYMQAWREANHFRKFGGIPERTLMVDLETEIIEDPIFGDSTIQHIVESWWEEITLGREQSFSALVSPLCKNPRATSEGNARYYEIEREQRAMLEELQGCIHLLAQHFDVVEPVEYPHPIGKLRSLMNDPSVESRYLKIVRAQVARGWEHQKPLLRFKEQHILIAQAKMHQCVYWINHSEGPLSVTADFQNRLRALSHRVSELLGIKNNKITAADDRAIQDWVQMERHKSTPYKMADGEDSAHQRFKRSKSRIESALWFQAVNQADWVGNQLPNLIKTEIELCHKSIRSIGKLATTKGNSKSQGQT